MPAKNGALAPDELKDHLPQRMREEAQAARTAAAGWASDGYNPYQGEWEMNLALPECPDKPIPGAEIDAWLVVAKPDKRTGRLRASTDALKRIHVTNRQELSKLREAYRWPLREWNWSPDPFAYGSEQGVPGVGGSMQQFLPLWPGPVTRQLYWQDYFAMSAKAFEAYNHDPLSWRCVQMKQQFALGKGVQGRVTYGAASKDKAGKQHDKATQVWEEFWDRNRMDNRMDMFARDLSVMGEQFLRYFKRGKQLTVRSLDPASVYDIITDPEDHETVFAFHQQFQAPYQLWAPGGATPPGGLQAPTGATTPGAATKYIIRQILPQEVDHYKTNSGAYERRGRSDLFPALGWIKRLRDYLTAQVIRADMLSRICWDLKVQGNAAAISAQRQALFPGGQPPQPGTVFGHNAAAELTAIVPTAHTGSAGSRGDPILDALATMVANSIGLPKEWLGMGLATTRANALVATEPATRSLEELQGMVETVLHDCFERVMRTAGINDAEIEFTFPSIATEDRTQKLQDLAYAEANQWVSKQTAAAIAAKELGITTYDFEEEQGLIAEEFPEPEMEDNPDAPVDPLTGKKPQRPKQGDGVWRRPAMVATMRQAPKLDPTKSPTFEDDPPGVLVPTSGGAASVPPAGGGGSAPPTRNGFPASENPASGAGAKNIKQDMQEAGVEPFSPEQVAMLLRAAAPRRRPDDPKFAERADEFRKQARKNLEQLATSVAK